MYVYKIYMHSIVHMPRTTLVSMKMLLLNKSHAYENTWVVKIGTITQEIVEWLYKRYKGIGVCKTEKRQEIIRLKKILSSVAGQFHQGLCVCAREGTGGHGK